jgi:hypothetical protein
MEINKAESQQIAGSGILAITPPKNEISIIDNYIPHVVARIQAHNLSGQPVAQVNVYISGREEAVLGTSFETNSDPKFWSSPRVPTLTTAHAIVIQGESTYVSGELTIRKSGYLDIDIYQTMVLMSQYADKERTEVIASTVLERTLSS